MQVSSGGPKHRKAVFNEINITPLTDIFLVLLIIMMVVAPVLSQSRQDIVPPSIAGGEGLDRDKLTIEITKEGQIYADAHEIAPDGLEAFLKERAERSQQHALVVKADKFTKNKVTMKVYESAKNAGFNEITIAGQALTENRSEELKKGSEPAAGTVTP